MNACCMVLVLRSRRRGPWRERERWQQEADEIVSLVSPWRKEEREKLRGPSSWHRTGGGAPNATMEVLESFPTETEERCPPPYHPISLKLKTACAQNERTCTRNVAWPAPHPPIEASLTTRPYPAAYPSLPFHRRHMHVRV
jgi:hypothetical protein